MTTSRSEPWRRAAWLSLLLAQGCAYAVQLESLPSGARVTLPDGSTLLTPARLEVSDRDRGQLRIEAPGYETLLVDLGRTEGGALKALSAAIWRGGRREVTFVLQPVTDPVGDAVAPP